MSQLFNVSYKYMCIIINTTDSIRKFENISWCLSMVLDRSWYVLLRQWQKIQLAKNDLRSLLCKAPRQKKTDNVFVHHSETLYPTISLLCGDGADVSVWFFKRALMITTSWY